MGRSIFPGEFYRHFKNKLYQIITVATHTETGEKMVVYQALYGDFKTYVRPYEMFVSEVDHVKYPDVLQKYRFERVQLSAVNSAEQDVTTNMADIKDLGQSKEQFVEEQVNPYLLQFLDADSYEQKLNVLQEIRSKVDETTLHSMAVAMDFTLTEGNREEKIDSLIYYLKTLQRYECNRLR